MKYKIGLKTSTLSEAFNSTEVISWGAFRIEKKIGQPWLNAQAYVHDKPLELQARPKEILGLLINLQGGPLRPGDMAKEFMQASTAEHAAINLKVQISKIRKEVRRVTGSEQTARLIASYKGRLRENAARSVTENLFGAYRLLSPE